MDVSCPKHCYFRQVTSLCFDFRRLRKIHTGGDATCNSRRTVSRSYYALPAKCKPENFRNKTGLVILAAMEKEEEEKKGKEMEEEVEEEEEGQAEEEEKDEEIEEEENEKKKKKINIVTIAVAAARLVVVVLLLVLQGM
ncbi:hypothetical protein PoB_007280100 [Plakobranchus ocellatus]|uniref:Transmembrane protein n=1 Tax=Plakobranchus ocellatus TaxID=259542 RepID=A0AAV4DQA0_9GAST|nr:hypothetical protein PoB_007280100 [Plakobranchus ocellatus]